MHILVVTKPLMKIKNGIKNANSHIFATALSGMSNFKGHLGWRTAEAACVDLLRVEDTIAVHRAPRGLA